MTAPPPTPRLFADLDLASDLQLRLPGSESHVPPFAAPI